MRYSPVFAALAVMVTACGQTAEDAKTSVDAPPATAILAVEVVEPSRGVHEISWSLDRDAAVTIAAVTNASAAPQQGIVVAEGVAGGSFSWQAPDPDQRYYFLVTPEGGESRIGASRVLALEGGRNFRDLGGYATESGERVAWGKVYRSGVMSGLTSGDYDYLDGLGIKVICDLRTAEERTNEPTNWAATPVETLTFPDPLSDGQSLLGAVFQKPDLTPDDVKAAMSGFYRDMLVQQDDAYTAMFDALAAGQTPLAFHCTAGKDRTGVGAALLLAALGVPEATIVEDYILSDKLVDYRKELDLDNATTAETDPYAFLRKLPPEIVAPLLLSDASYISAALEEARTKHGSLIGHIQSEYDVTDEELASLRTGLLIR